MKINTILTFKVFISFYVQFVNQFVSQTCEHIIYIFRVKNIFLFGIYSKPHFNTFNKSRCIENQISLKFFLFFFTKSFLAVHLVCARTPTSPLMRLYKQA